MPLFQFPIQLKETVCSRLAIIQTHKKRRKRWNVKTDHSHHPTFYISSVETRSRYGRFFLIWKREPSCLSDCGLLGAGNKLDILVCIKAPTAYVCTTRQALLMVFDMAGIIHMVRPARVCISKCFSFLRSTDDLPTSTVERVDAIWDPITLKNSDSEETWNRCSYTT